MTFGTQPPPSRSQALYEGLLRYADYRDLETEIDNMTGERYVTLTIHDTRVMQRIERVCNDGRTMEIELPNRVLAHVRVMRFEVEGFREERLRGVCRCILLTRDDRQRIERIGRADYPVVYVGDISRLQTIMQPIDLSPPPMVSPLTPEQTQTIKDVLRDYDERLRARQKPKNTKRMLDLGD